jgi:protein associated with RNAse G/E
MNMQIGEKIPVKAFKADGTCYRSWSATIDEIGPDYLITLAPVGDPVTDLARGIWNIHFALRSYYWFDKPYNLLEVFSPDGELAEIYINVASKPEIKEGILCFTDHELDVSRKPPLDAIIIDEDEFAEAIQKYNYSLDFQNEAYRIARECVEIANHWQARSFPY